MALTVRDSTRRRVPNPDRRCRRAPRTQAQDEVLAAFRCALARAEFLVVYQPFQHRRRVHDTPAGLSSDGHHGGFRPRRPASAQLPTRAATDSRGRGAWSAPLLPLAGHQMPNPEHEAAVMAAINNWLASTWLGPYNRERRFRGSIRVCSTDAQLAAQEIENWPHPTLQRHAHASLHLIPMATATPCVRDGGAPSPSGRAARDPFVRPPPNVARRPL